MDDQEKDLAPETQKEPQAAAPAEQAREICQKLIQFFQLPAPPRIRAWEAENKVMLEIDGDKSGILIGKHGLTLDSLEFVVSRIFQHQAGTLKQVQIDCEGYRKRKKLMLENMALETAREVAQTQEPIALGPMSSEERKIIHLALRNHAEVFTESNGLPPSRQVIVKPRKPEDQKPEA